VLVLVLSVVTGFTGPEDELVDIELVVEGVGVDEVDDASVVLLVVGGRVSSDGLDGSS
jgi:hypothetical protein